ncbi:hypothetical protein VTK26DRAFT_5097 [Humicola hyalothermophila]
MLSPIGILLTSLVTGRALLFLYMLSVAFSSFPFVLFPLLFLECWCVFVVKTPSAVPRASALGLILCLLVSFSRCRGYHGLYERISTQAYTVCYTKNLGHLSASPFPFLLCFCAILVAMGALHHASRRLRCCPPGSCLAAFSCFHAWLLLFYTDTAGQETYLLGSSGAQGFRGSGAQRWPPSGLSRAGRHCRSLQRRQVDSRTYGHKKTILCSALFSNLSSPSKALRTER